MNRILRKQHFSYKALEPRQLLAGDVSVVENGQLFIRGDESSNQIQIVATEDGEVLIQGLNTTTINGSTDAFVVSGSTDLHGARSRNAAFSGGLNIIMNGGHDRIDVRNIELQANSWISTGEGNDFFRFHKSTSDHDFQILAGDGDDTVRFFQARAMGDFDARTANGEDEVMFWNSRVWQDAVVMTGADDDTINASYSRFTGDTQRMLAQDGDDVVKLVRNNVGQSGISIDTGADHDRVIAEMAQENEVLGMITINGQSGMDALIFEGGNPDSDVMTSQGFENNGGEVVFAHEGEIDHAIEVVDRGEESRRFGAERVQFEDSTMITSVQWSGTYDSNYPATQDIFVVEIYEDTFLETLYEGDYNAPTGEPIARFTVGDGVGEDAVRTDTGKVLEGLTIFNFEANVAYEMQADKAYWVSIHSLVSTQVADDAVFFELGLLPYDPEIVNQSAYFTGGYNRRLDEFQSFWLPSARWDISLRS